jgi:hypothetical protein
VEVEEHRTGVPGADLPRVDELAALVVADEQRPESDPGPLRVREPADDELLAAVEECID